MNHNFTFPIALALFALVFALGPSRYFYKLIEVKFKWHREDEIRKKLAKLGKIEKSDFENMKIAELSLFLLFSAIPLLLLLLNAISLLASLLLLALAFLAATFMIQANLNRRCKKQIQEMEQEFPALVELLTLSIGSGESPAMALKRVAERGSGHLSREFHRLIEDFTLGISFSAALDLMAKRIEVQSLRRFVDTLIISISRGTPLVETMLHLTADARNREKSRLMLAAGKSEIRMMIPIVFLILPISILFALYPSIQNLNLFPVR